MQAHSDGVRMTDAAVRQECCTKREATVRRTEQAQADRTASTTLGRGWTRAAGRSPATDGIRRAVRTSYAMAQGVGVPPPLEASAMPAERSARSARPPAVRAVTATSMTLARPVVANR
jgi:hypothetical protein